MSSSTTTLTADPAEQLRIAKAKMADFKAARVRNQRPMYTLGDLVSIGYQDTVFGFTSSPAIIEGGR
jgi:hypothetical protein